MALVNSILDLNLIRTNKLRLYKEKINPIEFSKDILRLFEHQRRLRSIFLRLKVSTSAPKFLISDKNRLSQIMINLIGNALRFTNKGGITIFAGPCKQSREYVEISVQDV